MIGRSESNRKFRICIWRFWSIAVIVGRMREFRLLCRWPAVRLLLCGTETENCVNWMELNFELNLIIGMNRCDWISRWLMTRLAEQTNENHTKTHIFLGNFRCDFTNQLMAFRRETTQNHFLFENLVWHLILACSCRPLNQSVDTTRWTKKDQHCAVQSAHRTEQQMTAVCGSVGRYVCVCVCVRLVKKKQAARCIWMRMRVANAKWNRNRKKRTPNEPNRNHSKITLVFLLHNAQDKHWELHRGGPGCRGE